MGKNQQIDSNQMVGNFKDIYQYLDESNSLILTESILVFFIIRIIEVLAGIWLWERHKKGGKIGLIILPVSLSISIILNLQFLIIIHLAKIIFLAAAWKELK